MSIKLMSRVWDEAPFEQTRLLVLLTLADMARDDGECWPSIATIAKKARCSERHCRDIVTELEAAGWLERHLRTGKSTKYLIKFPADPAPTPEPQFTPTENFTPEPQFTPPRNPSSGDPGTPAPPNHKEPLENRVVVPEVPKTGAHWQPSDRALASAKELGPVTDIQLHIARYRVVKAERKTQPDSAEWLRWFIEDEKKARAEERNNEASQYRQRKWYDVAE